MRGMLCLGLPVRCHPFIEAIAFSLAVVIAETVVHVNIVKIRSGSSTQFVVIDVES